jgi:hypothetical protein
MEEVNITVDKETKVLELRTGQLPDILLPRTIDVDGAISNPGIFAISRGEELKANKVKCYVKIADTQIILVVDERKNNFDLIQGKLVSNPDIDAFGINTENTMSLNKFAEFLRFRKRYLVMDNKDVFINKFKNFETKVQTSVKQSKDDKGNYSSHVDRLVDAGHIPTEFDLKIPIFKGESDCKIKVYILFQIRNQEIEIALASEELVELEISERENIISDQVKILVENLPEDTPIFYI